MPDPVQQQQSSYAKSIILCQLAALVQMCDSLSDSETTDEGFQEQFFSEHVSVWTF